MPPGELKTPRRRNNRPPNVVSPVIAFSQVNSVSGNADLEYGRGSGSVSARVKTNTVDWDDDWSE